MSGKLSKDILFVSGLSQHSAVVLQMLTKYDIMTLFQVINIDKNRNKLPPVIKNVPCIFTTDRKVLEGEVMTTYIEHFIQNAGGVQELETGDLGGAYSSSYSFLGGDDQYNIPSSSYSSWNDDKSQKLNIQPAEQDKTSQQHRPPPQSQSQTMDRQHGQSPGLFSTNTRNNPDKEVTMEQMMSSRQQDLSNFIASNPKRV
jgi:hypothetical protein